MYRDTDAEKIWRVVCSDEATPKDLEFMLDGRAHGNFFVPDEGTSDVDLAKSDNHLYFGELPLSFAVSTNQPEMFNLLLEYAAKLPDGCFNSSILEVNKNRNELQGKSAQQQLLMMQGFAKGNNVLHMCVIHNHEDMYVHVKDWCRQQLREGHDVFEQLMATPNLEGQTPVMLAARLGMAKMVHQHMMM